MTLLEHPHRGLQGERWLQRIPAPLIEYPLETLLAAWGALSAPPILIGYSNPTSISSLLPDVLAKAWAVALFVGAVTVGYGLLRHRYGTTTARGLQLLGTACLCYAIAILAVVGWRKGIPGGPLLTVISALCYLRAWWLTTRARIMRRIEEASR